MNRVTRGYLGSERVLIDSRDQVYRPGYGWITVSDLPVIRIGQPYDKPLDVPAAWLGGCVWWRR